jgi:hypothetical protein
MLKAMLAMVLIVVARAALCATPIWGTGENTCQTYTALPIESAEADAHVQWISGYVIGKTFAVASVHQVPAAATIEALRLWLSGYCAANPQAAMLDAAEGFVAAYRFSRGVTQGSQR